MSETRFVRACRRKPVDRTPAWMMRQAGRYQPEYRALKERMGGFWGLCTNSDAIAEATLFAQRSLDTDAAIIFSDITVPGWGMGQELEFVPGPKFSQAVRTPEDVRALKKLDPAVKLSFLMDGIKKTRDGLPDDVSLIGFVGAPLTVAGYLIEGYPSRSWRYLKEMTYGRPAVLRELLDRLVEALIDHARAQIQAGCDTIQVFDSTAGQLASDELGEFAFESSARVIAGLKNEGVPLIYFARDVGSHLEAAADVGADVLGVDWTVRLDEAKRRVGDKVALMGNLDPTILFCQGDVVKTRAEEVLEQSRGLEGYIFNLGHGILPETPVENAKLLIETVHSWT